MDPGPGSVDRPVSKPVETGSISKQDDKHEPSSIDTSANSRTPISPTGVSSKDTSLPKVNIVEPTPTETTSTELFPSEAQNSGTSETQSASSPTDPVPTASTSIDQPFELPINTSSSAEPTPQTNGLEESAPKADSKSGSIEDVLSKATLQDPPLIDSAPSNVGVSSSPTDAPLADQSSIQAALVAATPTGGISPDSATDSASKDPALVEKPQSGNTAIVADATESIPPEALPTAPASSSTTAVEPAAHDPTFEAPLPASSKAVDSTSAKIDETESVPAEFRVHDPVPPRPTSIEPIPVEPKKDDSHHPEPEPVEPIPVELKNHNPVPHEPVPVEPTGTELPKSENEPIEPEVIDQTLVVDSRSVSDDSDYITEVDRQSITTSLSSKITDFEFSNGRRYHAFGEDAYWLPNDATEIERLDIQHHVWRLSLNGALHIAPLIPSTLHHVLDIGTGTGRWALDFAEAHPHINVLGTDLSPIQPPYVPRNCSFLIDNAENDWIFDDKFDFIHSRMLIMGIHDWPRFFRQSWDNLNPGGWLEVKEPQFPIICVDDSATATTPLMAFSLNVRESAAKAGIDTMIVHQFKDMLERQGFVNIRVEPVKWPVGPWPRGEALKMIGRWMVPDTKEFVKPAGMKLFTTHLEWSRERVDEFMEEVLRDIDDRRTHYHWLIFAICAQKPDSAG